MTEKNGCTRLVSYEQIQTIVDFMGQHVDFALGKFRCLEGRHTAKKLWDEVAKKLNSCRGGTRKTAFGWSKYWSDLKNKIKKKILLIKKSKTDTSLKEVTPLTKLEKRVISILGPFFEKRRRRRHSSDTYLDDTPPEVKLENFQDIAHLNNYSKSQSESSNILLGADDQSNDSAESSSGGFINDNDMTLQNIYPQWLVDVEKKRADAELIRAKAEEQRATVATKTAEAALVQADALKRLADAASVQAEAIMRIATTLENREHAYHVI